MMQLPIYGYRCEVCGHEFETNQSVGEPIKRKCPECGALKLRRKFYPVSIHFKGSGFHVTDYGSK